MGTKNNPGLYDCYAKAEPDEPIFVLLGRDPAAWIVVRIWAALRRYMDQAEPDQEDPKLDEAERLSYAMQKWLKTNRRGRRILSFNEVNGVLRQGGW